MNGSALYGSPWSVVTALTGPFVGSFVAATADRMVEGAPVFTARSRCAACNHALRPFELVPILSWLSLRGRCARCSAPIPTRLLGAEIAGLAIGLVSALAAPGWLALASALLGWALLLLALLDLRAFWLPRLGGWMLAAAGLAVNAALGREQFHAALVGGALGWVTLAATGFAYARLRHRDGLGEGDPPLLAAAGAWVGWPGLPTVVLLAGLTGLAHGLLIRRAAEPTRVPFGAHLGFALWFVWLSGPV